MRIWMMGLAILASISPAHARPTADHETVPFELSGGRIYVQVLINGRGPYRFGFDTGASGVGRADTRLTTELGLPTVTQAQNSDGVATTTADVVSVDSISLGPITRRKAELLSRDYNRSLKPENPPMMGIVGRDFFARKLLIIDYPARTIRFREGGLNPKEPGVLPYRPGFAIPICFAALCVPAKVDTGSSRGLVLPKDVADKVAVGAAVLLGQAARTNSSVSLYEVPVRGPVRIGALTAPLSKVVYADPSTDTVNIGSDFLKDYVLTIDSTNALLRIAKPAR